MGKKAQVWDYTPVIKEGLVFEEQQSIEKIENRIHLL
jgi:hypothetical protein